jgi:hypothetical protein
LAVAQDPTSKSVALTQDRASNWALRTEVRWAEARRERLAEEAEALQERLRLSAQVRVRMMASSLSPEAEEVAAEDRQQARRERLSRAMKPRQTVLKIVCTPRIHLSYRYETRTSYTGKRFCAEIPNTFCAECTRNLTHGFLRLRKVLRRACDEIVPPNAEN